VSDGLSLALLEVTSIVKGLDPDCLELPHVLKLLSALPSLFAVPRNLCGC
jgi:hypothetical protein